MKSHTEILANLEEIENVAKMACEEAKGIWARLRVRDVVHHICLNNEEFVEVILCETHYDELNVYPWMRQFFLDRGYKNPPEFRFEW